MSPKKKSAETAAPEPRFGIREQDSIFQIIDTTNGYVHAVTGARDEADSMAASLNANPPEET